MARQTRHDKITTAHAGYYPADNSKPFHTSSPDDDKKELTINTKPLGIAKQVISSRYHPITPKSISLSSSIPPLLALSDTFSFLSEEGERKERRRRSPSQASSRSASVFSRLRARRENEREYRQRKWEDSRDEPLESEDRASGRNWKRQSKRARKGTKDDLSEPYDEESTTPFTRRINKIVLLKRIQMPTTVKTYDATGDPKDHLKTFTKLPPESTGSFKDLRKKFLVHYLQQKRYTKDSVELHHMNQKEGESTKAFMERFTSESLMFKGALELKRISEFMHGITHPGLIKRLNDNIPKTVDEMMSVTKAFIQGEKATVM
ncbi:reverse transcriptase domain-containing protein [Tanacetum coccineum]